MNGGTIFLYILFTALTQSNRNVHWQKTAEFYSNIESKISECRDILQMKKNEILEKV